MSLCVFNAVENITNIDYSVKNLSIFKYEEIGKYNIQYRDAYKFN